MHTIEYLSSGKVPSGMVPRIGSRKRSKVCRRGAAFLLPMLDLPGTYPYGIQLLRSLPVQKLVIPFYQCLSVTLEIAPNPGGVSA